MKIAVIGSTGMLGSTLCQFLYEKDCNVLEINRSGKSVIARNRTFQWNAISDSYNGLYDPLRNFEFIINCVGLIPQKCELRNSDFTLELCRLNVDLPIKLSQIAKESGIRVIQIGTDCVYSGRVGKYVESDVKDPIDSYGYSKALGESASNDLIFLRTSIIGRELKSSVSLLEWVLSRPFRARIPGYINHKWNGITTLAFAQICWGIINSKELQNTNLHLVPEDYMSKYELLRAIANHFHRKDLDIYEFMHSSTVDRTLSTTQSDLNRRLWNLAGYPEVPSIDSLISEYAGWTNRH